MNRHIPSRRIARAAAAIVFVAGIGASAEVAPTASDHKRGHSKPADCLAIAPREDDRAEVCFPDVDGYQKHSIGGNRIASFCPVCPGNFVREIGVTYIPRVRSTERRHLQIHIRRYVSFPRTVADAGRPDRFRAWAARVLVGASLYDEDGNVYGLLEKTGDDLAFHCRPLEPLATLNIKQHTLDNERHERDDVNAMVRRLIQRYLADDPPATPVSCS